MPPPAEARGGQLQRPAISYRGESERLVAVWDGSPPSAKGPGTADTVLEAQAAGLPVDVLWPDGAARGA